MPWHNSREGHKFKETLKYLPNDGKSEFGNQLRKGHWLRNCEHPFKPDPRKARTHNSGHLVVDYQAPDTVEHRSEKPPISDQA